MTTTTIPPTDTALLALIDRVQTARAVKGKLNVRGGGSKAFYGEAEAGELLDTRALTGVSNYEPTELVVSARCGTSLATLEALLAEQGQCLPFEPPHFGSNADGPLTATVGGMVAAGLAGPSRAAVGSVRDYVLGVTILSGKAEVLSFGGQVMKNVAGYDVSRLLAGSLGTLGVILEVSLKVLPVAPATATLRFEMGQADALGALNRWGGQPLPINASAWWDGNLLVRLSGAVAAVQAARIRLGGSVVDAESAASFWRGLRDQRDAYFVRARAAVADGATLWRLGLPQTAARLDLPGERPGDQLIEWGGAQRWLVSRRPATELRAAAAALGGHATLFDGRDKSAGVFAPLTPPIARIHQGLKQSFDPDGIFNPGRLYSAKVHPGL
jgi:glycolate oxidase FAD binding subunit